MREAEKKMREAEGLSDAKLGKLRHGLAEMWESVRIGASEDTRGKELWRGMLQLFHNLEGVDYGREHLEDADSDSESDCSYSDSETDGSDSDCEGRFNRFTGEGRWWRIRIRIRMKMRREWEKENKNKNNSNSKNLDHEDWQ
jgi:hypothetical protein